MEQNEVTNWFSLFFFLLLFYSVGKRPFTCFKHSKNQKSQRGFLSPFPKEKPKFQYIWRAPGWEIELFTDLFCPVTGIRRGMTRGLKKLIEAMLVVDLKIFLVSAMKNSIKTLRTYHFIIFSKKCFALANFAVV